MADHTISLTHAEMHMLNSALGRAVQYAEKRADKAWNVHNNKEAADRWDSEAEDWAALRSNIKLQES